MKSSGGAADPPVPCGQVIQAKTISSAIAETKAALQAGAEVIFEATFAADGIRTMGRIAKDEKCQFMLVCGDAPTRARWNFSV